LGYDHYKIFLTLQNLTKDRLKEFIGYLRFDSNVTYITKPMGYHNLEIEVMFQRSTELHEFMRSLTYKFSDILQDYETLLVYEEPIIKYLPLE